MIHSTSNSHEVDRKILLAPLRIPQVRWTSADIAEFTGVSQSAVARVWRKYFAPDFDTTVLPAEVEILEAHYLDDQGYLVMQVLNETKYETTSASDMRSPRRIPLQSMLSGIMLTPRSNLNLSASNSILKSRESNNYKYLVIGTAFRPEFAQTHINYLELPKNLWQGLLPYLISAAHQMPAGNLRELHQQIVAWAHEPTSSFSWTSNTKLHSKIPRDPALLANPRSTQQVIADQIFDQIVFQIWSGKLTSGDRITESSLAKILHTSRNQMRDALRTLATSGLLDNHPVRGVSVPIPKQSDVLEIYIARKALGFEILKRAISNPHFPIEKVKAALDEVIRISETGNSYATGNADLDFQDVIAECSGLRNMPQMFRILAQQLRIYIAVLGYSYVYSIEEMVSDDEQIYTLLLKRDFEAAKKAWNKKINNSVAYMTGHIRV